MDEELDAFKQFDLREYAAGLGYRHEATCECNCS
jgi:hypothetical protein